MDKPEALATICDRLETAGRYTPPKPLDIEEYLILSARAVTLATRGNLKSARHIRELITRHAPEPIQRLQKATYRATETDRHHEGAKRQLLALNIRPL